MNARESRSVREQLRGHQVVICDSAMGAMLQAGGGIAGPFAFLQLNVSRPALARDLHAAYVSAGAQILQTNTSCSPCPGWSTTVPSSS